MPIVRDAYSCHLGHRLPRWSHAPWGLVHTGSHNSIGTHRCSWVAY